MPASTPDSQVSEYDDHSELSGRRNNLYSLPRQFSDSRSRRPRVPGWNLEVSPTLRWSVVCLALHQSVRRGLDAPVLCGKGQVKPFLHTCSTSPRNPTSQSRYRNPSALLPPCCEMSTDGSFGLQRKHQPRSL